MQTKRIFIAAEFPAEIIDQIIKVTHNQWPNLRQGIRWVPPKQLHLTLKFMGDQSVHEIIPVQRVCQSVFSGKKRIPLRLNGFGVFPNLTRPTVLWVGMQQTDELIQLQAQLEKALAEIQIPQENRPFKPHLTLARIKPFFPSQDLPRLIQPISEGAALLQQETCIERLVLYESQLSSQGSTYIPLEIYPLE